LVHVVVNEDVQRSMERAVVNYVQERLRHVRNGSLLSLFKEEARRLERRVRSWNRGNVKTVYGHGEMGLLTVKKIESCRHGTQKNRISP
jgi:hypothetical protein